MRVAVVFFAGLIAVGATTAASACEFHDGAFGYASWMGAGHASAMKEDQGLPDWYVDVLKAKAEKAGRVDPIVESLEAAKVGEAESPAAAERPSFSSASSKAAQTAMTNLRERAGADR